MLPTPALALPLPPSLLWLAAQVDPTLGFWERLARGEDPGALFRAAVLVFVGIPLLVLAARWLRRWVGARTSPQQGMVAGKAVLYPGLLLIFVSVLHQLEFSLTPLLGAAGIVGIAIGFASQTSVSNVISGFFLIAERPFEVDDIIQVGDVVGRVLSIDTLSVKLRTFDNRFVRIPNETIVKSQVTTITRFPIRRLDLNVGVAYKEDVGRVRKLLLEVVEKNPRALMEPEPAVFFDAYGDSALELRLAVWATRENFISLKNSLLEEVKARFDEEGIEIPFPHRTLYSGAATDPFPVRVVPPGGGWAGADLEEPPGSEESGSADPGAGLGGEEGDDGGEEELERRR
jgi:small-conductance mechanosensitive channel